MLSISVNCDVCEGVHVWYKYTITLCIMLSISVNCDVCEGVHVWYKYTITLCN